MAGMLTRLMGRVRYGKPVVVVSGLPRSGTSMAMKMIEAGGLEIVADHVRTADEDNPKGYFEDERVKDLGGGGDTSWVGCARGKAIKVVSSLISHLPAANAYRVVFMLRNLHEVLASQAKMLDRRGEVSETDDQRMMESYQKHLDKVRFQLRFRSNFETLYVKYTEAVADPRRAAARINAFLGGGLDVELMVAAVDGSLYRNRFPEGEAGTGGERS